MGRRVLGGAVCVLLVSAGLGGVAHARYPRRRRCPGRSRAATGCRSCSVASRRTGWSVARILRPRVRWGTPEEFFLEGTAGVLARGGLLAHVRWPLGVEPTSQAAFATRVVVNRPVDRRDFNGTVVVEWLNVSGGSDASPDWMHTHVELIGGYAWVGVRAGRGAQRPQGRATGEIRRCASLTHPGDSYSYDMFSQAQAIRDGRTCCSVGCVLDRLIAAGESQSAGRLVTYIDAVHPVAQVYDGFLVHSRNVSGAPLAQAPLAPVPTPAPTLIRDDLDVPVLVFNTETDVGSLQARQPDSATYRLWEVAGTALRPVRPVDRRDRHGTACVGGRGSTRCCTRRTGRTPVHVRPADQHGSADLRAPLGDRPPGPLDHPGHATATAPRWETTSVPVEYVLDANGNVQAASTAGRGRPRRGPQRPGPDGTTFCFLFGTTTPLTPDQLGTLYGDHGGFVRAWATATLEATQPASSDRRTPGTSSSSARRRTSREADRALLRTAVTRQDRSRNRRVLFFPPEGPAMTVRRPRLLPWRRADRRPVSVLRPPAPAVPGAAEAHHGVVMVTGYEEAVSVLTDTDTFSSCNSVTGPFPAFPSRSGATT